MRNTEIITAISTKIAAAISERTGTTVPVITAEDAEDVATAPGNSYPEVPFVAYDRALRAVGVSANAVDDLSDALTWLNYYATHSRHPEVTAREENALEQIPRAFWPDRTDGTSHTDDARFAAEEPLTALYDDTSGYPERERDSKNRWYDSVAAQFVPAGFEPEGEGEAAAVERRLAGWAAMRAARDGLVRNAVAAGVTKTRIHQITGISRATIDRILRIVPIEENAMTTTETNVQYWTERYEHCFAIADELERAAKKDARSGSIPRTRYAQVRKVAKAYRSAAGQWRKAAQRAVSGDPISRDMVDGNARDGAQFEALAHQQRHELDGTPVQPEPTAYPQA